jgi:ABC-type transport system substrate-binding protein
LYADNYKYNISENPTDEELINLTFQYAGDAERSFLNLRQKREAAELSAERYKDRANKYTAEADRLYDQAITETDPAKKRQLSEQATEMSRKAAECRLRYRETTNWCRNSPNLLSFIFRI